MRDQTTESGESSGRKGVVVFIHVHAPAMHPGALPQSTTYTSVIGLISEIKPFSMPTVVDTYR